MGAMRRPPNIAISAWFRQNSLLDRPWVINALCGERIDLPWVANSRPSDHDELRMASVCDECPVIQSCAAYGLTTAGGFYAGVWVPWKSVSGETADTRLIRAHARRRLRNLVEPGRRGAGRPRTRSLQG